MVYKESGGPDKENDSKHDKHGEPTVTNDDYEALTELKVNEVEFARRRIRPEEEAAVFDSDQEMPVSATMRSD